MTAVNLLQTSEIRLVNPRFDVFNNVYNDDNSIYCNYLYIRCLEVLGIPDNCYYVCLLSNLDMFFYDTYYGEPKFKCALHPIELAQIFYCSELYHDSGQVLLSDYGLVPKQYVWKDGWLEPYHR